MVVFVKYLKMVFVFTVLFVGLVSVGVSQTCLQPDSASYRHFPQGDPNDPVTSGIVYYSFENIPDGPQRTQIVAALNNWNSALDAGSSNVTFVPGSVGEYGSSLIIKNGPIPNFGAARSEETTFYGNEISVGTMTLNPNLVINGFLFYDPAVSGYNNGVL